MLDVGLTRRNWLLVSKYIHTDTDLFHMHICAYELIEIPQYLSSLYIFLKSYSEVLATNWKNLIVFCY